MTKITLIAKTELSKTLNYNELFGFSLEVSLPVLTGTERQVKWANDLRAKFLGQMKTRILGVAQNAYNKSGNKTSEFTNDDLALCQKAASQMIISTVVFLHKNQSAAFWIENESGVSANLMTDWFRTKSGFKSPQDIMDCYSAI